MIMDEARSITLRKQLCEEAEKKFGARFGSMEGILEAVLAELLRDDALKMDEREQQIITERLKALGYV